MQEEPGAPFGCVASVGLIADKGVSLALEVQPDLMQPAGVEHQLHKAVALSLWADEVTDVADFSERTPPLLRDDTGATTLPQHREEGRVEKPRGHLQPAVAQADVHLPDAPCSKEDASHQVAMVAPGPEEQPRSVPIQPMKKAVAHAGIMRDGMPIAKPRGQPSLQRPRAAAWTPSLELRNCIFSFVHRDRPVWRLPKHAEIAPIREHRGRLAGGLCVFRGCGTWLAGMRCCSVQRHRLPLQEREGGLQEVPAEAARLLQGADQTLDVPRPRPRAGGAPVAEPATGSSRNRIK